MKKLTVILTGIALLFLGATARAALIDPSDVHVNDSTAYLFGSEVHAITNPSTISLAGSHAGVLIDIFLGLAVPGDTNISPATITGVGSGVDKGDLTAGMDVYNDVLGLSGANNSMSFTNFTLYANQGVTNFDIWEYDLNAVLSQASPVDVYFTSGPPDGTYLFAYGLGSDGKLYVTPFTESGFERKIPEPGIFLLLSMGLIGFWLVGRMNLRKQKGYAKHNHR